MPSTIWTSAFGAKKIRNWLSQNDEMARLRQPQLDLISASSAMVIRDILEKVKDKEVITLDDIQEAVKGTSLEGSWENVLDGATEDDGELALMTDPPPQKKGKRGPYAKRKSKQVQQAVETVAGVNVPLVATRNTEEIQVDEDDYD